MSNPRLLSADIEFGANKQENIIHSLRNYFQSSNIEATKDKYCIYDAEDSSTHTRYEIKTKQEGINLGRILLPLYHTTKEMPRKIVTDYYLSSGSLMVYIILNTMMSYLIVLKLN